MKVVALYHPQSEEARSVEDFAHEFEKMFPGRHIELVSLETKEGADTAKVYDIVRYPAILAFKDDGQLLKYWDEEQLPLMNEVAYYTAETA